MRTLILSLSRSGSTALFYSLYSSLQPRPIIYFEPKAIYDCEIIGQKNVLVKIVTDAQPKNLQLYSSLINQFDKVISLVRDPRDRMISGFLFGLHNVDKALLNYRLQQLRKKELSPESYPFLQLVEDTVQDMGAEKLVDYLQQLYQNHEKVLNRSKDYFILRYEDIVNKEYNKLSEYMGVSIHSDNIKLEERHVHGMRKMEYGDWKNWLVKSDIEILKPVFESLDSEYSRNLDWEITNNPIIQSRHASEFVLNAHNANEKLKQTGTTWGN